MPKQKGAQAVPSSEGSLAEDLIETLQNARVVEALGKALSPLITLSVEEGLKKQIEGLTASVRGLKEDNVRLQGQYENISKENTRLSKLVEEQEKRIEEMEAYSRVENLIIRGLPEKTIAEVASGAPALDDSTSTLRESHKSVETTVIDFCREALGVTVQQHDISIAHRVKAGTNDKVRPIIVRFTNRQTRNAVYSAKKLLKNRPIYISEHLTKHASDLFYEARQLLKKKKIFATWTQGCHVFVKFSDDPTARPVLVKCNADLNPGSH